MKDTPYAPNLLRERTLEELRGLLAQLKRENFELRIMVTTSQLKDTNRMKTTRRNIARVLTELKSRSTGKRGGKNV